MMSSYTTHKLVAIVFTDIVGYTVLMGKDEASALTLLDQNREYHKKYLKRFNGTLLKEMGDGLLIEFETISDAVYCAGCLINHLDEVPGLNIRVGIHEGEVSHDGKDVFGDGVNIASRLQEIATPGQILASESINMNIKNKEGIKSTPVGSRELKNVDEKLNVYQIEVDPNFVFTGSTIRPQRRIRKVLLPTAIAMILLLLILNLIDFRKEKVLVNEKSIAVLPFEVIGSDEEGEYFAAGIRDVLINQLNNISDLQVRSKTSADRVFHTASSISEIANELDVNYVIEASTQKIEDDVRIIVQLIDVKHDDHIWQNDYILKHDNIFKVQQNLVFDIVDEMQVIISDEDKGRISKLPTENQIAWDLYMKGKHLKSTWSMNSLKASMTYFERAIQLDSNFVQAYIELNLSYLGLGVWFGDMSGQEAYRKGKGYIEKALQIDPTNLEANVVMAYNKYFFEWDFSARDSVAKIIAIVNPEFEDHHLDLMLGRYKKIIEETNVLRKVNPYFNNQYHMPLAYAYFKLGDVDEAKEVMKEGMKMFPNQEGYFDHFGNIQNAIGNYYEAIKILEEGLRISDRQHPSMIVHLSIAYKEVGDQERSDQLLQALIDRANSGEPEINVFISHYYGFYGLTEEAFPWLEEAFANHEVDLLWLAVEPNLEPIKDDPRYIDLMKRVGFPTEIFQEMVNEKRL